MVQKKVIFFSLIMLMFIFSFVSADSIGTFKKEKSLEIYQECNNCTSCNFTRVKYPNGTNFLTNIEATKDDTYYHSTILKGNLTEVGTYSYCYDCGNAVEKSTGCLDFEITYNGHELTTERSFLYLGLIGFLLFIFCLILFLIPQIPMNKTDEDGLIIELSSLKYLRPILIALDWIILLAIIFLTSNVAIAYLPFNMFGELLFNIYTIMFWLTIIAIPIWFIYLFLSAFRHKEMKRLMQRGVEFGGKGL